MNLLSLLAVMIYMGPVYIVVIFAIYKWNGYEHILGRYIGRRGQKSIVEKVQDEIEEVVDNIKSRSRKSKKK